MVAMLDFDQLKICFPVLKTYLSKTGSMKAFANSRERKLEVTSEYFWKEYDSKEGKKEEELEVVQKMLVAVVVHVLRLEEDVKINLNQPLRDLGFDSLFLVGLVSY